MVGFGSLSSGLLANQIRGGDNEIFIDFSDVNCGIKPGLSYVENSSIQKKKKSLFAHKARNGIILVTDIAVCQLRKIHGTEKAAIQAITQHFGVTNPQQFARKTVSSLLIATGFGIPLITKILFIRVVGVTGLVLGLQMTVF